MKTRIVSSILGTIILLASATASADSVLHIWTCQLKEGNTTAELMAVSSAWLKAARSMDGGADMNVYLDYPIAADGGAGRFSFVMEVADEKTWGIFMNGYEDSAAAEADEAFNEIASCSGSSIWGSVEVE